VTTVAVTSERQSRLARAADLSLRVPVTDTAVVQELHMLVTHVLCDVAEAELAQAAERR
jgi:D-sedoheptulose 7-phosphate isomerase